MFVDEDKEKIRNESEESISQIWADLNDNKKDISIFFSPYYYRLKPNEEKVLNAIQTLMENIDQIEIFNKKAIYLYMREITGLNTKQIVSCLNKMRERYRLFKKKWDEGEIK